MKRDQVVAELKKIGLQKALAKSPIRAQALIAQVHKSAQIPTTDQRKEEVKRLLRFRKAVQKLQSATAALSPGSMQMLDWGGEPNLLKLQSALEALEPGFALALEAAKHDVGPKGKRGRKPLASAQSVAAACAEIWVLAYGETPGYGRHAERHSEATGEFCRTVGGILKILGIQVGDVAHQCEIAVQQADVNGILLGAMNERRRGPSIFDFAAAHSEKLR